LAPLWPSSVSVTSSYRLRAREAAAQSAASVIGHLHLPEVWRLYPEV